MSESHATGACAFEWPLRVYYEDTDASGVVYHANYLRYFERARTEWLRALGCNQDALRAEHGVVFTVSRIEVVYRLPARLDDELAATVAVSDCKRASLVMQQRLNRRGASPVTLASAEVRIACVHADSFRPTALPALLRAHIDPR